MAGTPMKLTFDLDYPDHAQAYAILKSQKHTTQFVVNLILGVDSVPTAKSNRQVTVELPKSNPQVTQVTRVTEGTTLDDIPSALLGFIEE